MGKSLVFPFIMLLSRTVLFGSMQLLAIFIFALSWEESVAWWPFYAVATNLTGFMLLSLLARRDGTTYLERIHFDRTKLWRDIKQVWWIFLAGGIAGGIGFSGFGFLINGTLQPPDTMIQSLPVWAAILALIFFPLTNALAELPTYMGYSFPKIEKAMRSTRIAVFLCASFLAFQHVTLPVTLMDFRFMLWHFVSMIPLALTVAFIFVRIRRLLPIMIVHYAMDVMAVIGVFTLSLGWGA
ncbi:type II CAAX prenyl endopeptidase Rce1 family protein [Paenibacillus sp.]|uniref:CPBP family glutamic-type intramembrane protease n=1 Tax=Paenibacillus sp. TaxID=58172 RepID=UPI002812199A|nr:CPBP family glutamic-type intramembrane protease [Paenibacillus sp.]